jgi:hypothetical protein
MHDHKAFKHNALRPLVAWYLSGYVAANLKETAIFGPQTRSGMRHWDRLFRHAYRRSFGSGGELAGH